MSLIFEESKSGRIAKSQWQDVETQLDDLPRTILRCAKPLLPEVSELQVVRHYTRLSQQNFSIDSHFYPLGSCTMKYNPRGVHHLAMQPQWLNGHPQQPAQASQGFLSILFELQEVLADITGMQAMALSPMAGSQGELAGVMMIKAYHEQRGDSARTEMLIPDAAHGTNPASAVMAGFKTREIPTAENGDVDLEALKKVVGPQTAGIMLTNPSTSGIFGRRIKQVADCIHDAGGLLYYDGANLNAILGKTRPGDMGFDVVHLNLHKTFATPHGGGGPGAGPVGVSERLLPFLPVPRVAKKANGQLYWQGLDEIPNSIGRMSTFMGNAGILLRAYLYIRLLGREGLTRVAEFATLNANYLQTQLAKAGFTLAYPTRRATHEFIISLANEKQQFNVNAMDVAKRLLDYGFHAPTTYFPLHVPECFLIEPTETESKEVCDQFVNAMIAIAEELKNNVNLVKDAPHSLSLQRLDEVKAAKQLDIMYAPI